MTLLKKEVLGARSGSARGTKGASWASRPAVPPTPCGAPGAPEEARVGGAPAGLRAQAPFSPASFCSAHRPSARRRAMFQASRPSSPPRRTLRSPASGTPCPRHRRTPPRSSLPSPPGSATWEDVRGVTGSRSRVGGALDPQVGFRVRRWGASCAVPPLSPAVGMRSALLCLLLQLPFTHLLMFTLSVCSRHPDLVAKGTSGPAVPASPSTHWKRVFTSPGLGLLTQKLGVWSSSLCFNRPSSHSDADPFQVLGVQL